MGKGRNGKFHIYAHKKSKMKFKVKLKDLTSRKRPGKLQDICSELKRVVIGWLNYYGIAEMKTWISATNGWLQSRIRQIIWKRWKKPITKYRKLIQGDVPKKYAYMTAYSRRGYWFTVHTSAVKRALSNEKLASLGYLNLSTAYERIHSYPVQLQFAF